MSTKKYLLIVLILVQLNVLNLYAEEQTAPSPSPFVGFLTNIKESHTGWNSVWHLAALGATGIMISTPVDQTVVEAEKHHLGENFSTGASIVGTMWHILPAAIVHLATDNPEYKYASGAVVQAVGISFLVTSMEKFIFGRALIDTGDDNSPDFLHFKKSTDARDFYPFQNLFGLWPSGHTATAFAAASALTAFYRDDENFLKVAVITYTASALMGLARIDGNYHWASDVIAGFLIGHAIGWTVGTDFRSRYRGSSTAEAATRPSFIPLIASGNYGFQVRIPY